MNDYIKFYNLEQYLFNEVNKRFHEQGFLNHYELHCIFVWKSNRAKYKNADKIKLHGLTYEESAIKFTKSIAVYGNAKERFKYVTGAMKFRLPTASAILTVLYPNEFSVYDYRVCEYPGMEMYKNLTEKKGENLWQGYQKFIQNVKILTPENLTLREKDQWLWGWSFHKDLMKDCINSIK